MSKQIKIKALENGFYDGYLDGLNFDTIFTAVLDNDKKGVMVSQEQIVAAGAKGTGQGMYFASGLGTLPKEYNIVEVTDVSEASN